MHGGCRVINVYKADFVMVLLKNDSCLAVIKAIKEKNHKHTADKLSII